MKLYNIDYEAGDVTGVATISACNAKEASTVLQSLGKHNAFRYKCTNIKEIGESAEPTAGIVSEDTITPVEIINQDTTPSTPNPPSNVEIRKLNKYQIQELKVRINQDSGVLYVDRIGKFNFNIDREHFPDKGYSVFVVYPEETYNESNDRVFDYKYVGHLLVSDGTKMIDFGSVIYKFTQVESYKKEYH